MQITIKTLKEKGYNITQISKILKIDRKTVRKVLKQFELQGYVERKNKSSIIDEHKEYLEIQATKGLSAKRIYQDLVREYNFNGGYDVVRKYVSNFKKKEKVYMVLNALPGEEAQVDFGYIGTLEFMGKRRKAWVFIMTLSYSRYMYAEVVFEQTVKTFITCHRNAFKYFKGVPKTVKIDNLKSGILEADFYEPIVQKHYAAFSNHYGFMVEACRVYTPTDKGKVESNVNYVKENCFKGRNFKDYENAKKFLIEWLETIANNRVHGTTKKVPCKVFEEIEKSKLLPLPNEEYVFSSSEKTTVNSNCHISYKSNYYSVPYAYVGQTVEVLEVNNIIKVFYKNKEIALHPLIKDKKGQYETDKNHYPYSKNISREEILSRQRESMEEIGKAAVEFFEKFYGESNQRKYDYKTITGILSLRKLYDDEVINDACRRANEYGAYSYRVIKKICENGIIDLPINRNQTYINETNTYMARNLAEYDLLAEKGASLNE